MVSLSTTERDAARYMALDGVASSETAEGIVDRLATGFAHGSDRAPGKPLEKAIAAILCDFLQAEALSPGRWSYRPMGTNTFSGQWVGSRAFRRAIDAMSAHRWLDVVGGHQQWGRVAGVGPRVPMWNRATRLRPRPWLLRFMAERGVTPENWKDHFELIVPEGYSVEHPLVLRKRSLRIGNESFRGFGMDVDRRERRTRVEFERIDLLNRRFEGVQTTPVPFRGFRRIFNDGDVPGFDWNKGGRLYAVGGSYQTMKRTERPSLLLNDEATVEIDVKASHPTILAKLSGQPLGPRVDPYIIDGLPRDVAKAFWTMTLGHGGFHRAWPRKILERLEPTYGHPLRKQFPLKLVRQKVIEAFPFLERWGSDRLSALDLQYIESEAILLAVEQLAYGEGVFALSLHDSLIVQQRSAKVTEEVLSSAYKEVVGVAPTLERRE